MNTEYPRKSVGHILHHLRDLGVPETVAGSVTVGAGVVNYNGNFYCKYKYFNGIEQPLFYFDKQQFINRDYSLDLEKKVAKPNFRLSLYVHNTASLVVSGQLATQSLREFMLGMMTNRKFMFDLMLSSTVDPRYKIREESGAFFQGGYVVQDETTDVGNRFIFIEFAIPSGAQAFVDYVNENFSYELDEENSIKFRNDKPFGVPYRQNNPIDDKSVVTTYD